MRGDENVRACLRALIEGPDWANMGERGDSTHDQAHERESV
jgi:hypothetical protein